MIITAPLSRRTKRKQSSHFPRDKTRCVILLLSAVLAVTTLGLMSMAITMLAKMLLSSSFISGGGRNDDNAVISSSSSSSSGRQDNINTRIQSLFLRHQSTINSTTNDIDIELAASSSLLSKISNDNVMAARGLIIHTHLGKIHIHFTPELSGPSSIQYIVGVVRRAQSIANEESIKGQERSRRIQEDDDVGYACTKCNFYRAESNLLLQGIISITEDLPSHHAVGIPKNIVELGPCPDEKYHISKVQRCPEHDPNCGCHGPIMTRGMVGWAGGKGGPDFFINTFATPVDWWENQHTVWGMIHDDASLSVVEETYNLPAHIDGMRMLDEKIEFLIELF